MYFWNDGRRRGGLGGGILERGGDLMGDGLRSCLLGRRWASGRLYGEDIFSFRQGVLVFNLFDCNVWKGIVRYDGTY